MRALVVCLVFACSSSKEKTPPPPPPAPIVVADAAVTSGRTSEVRVDRRVELLAIVMRLTGTKEYQRAQATPYVRAVDAHFAGFRGHRAVLLATELRKKGIGYDAPMQLAVHLDARLRPVNAAELPGIDARWKDIDVAAYATDLADFATVTGLDEFLEEQAPYLRSLETQLRGMLAAEDPIPWFDAAFGHAAATFVVIPCPLAGTWNFGARATVDNKLSLFQILGVSTPDGAYRLDAMLTELLVHEMAHSYVNPVMAAHWTALAPSVTTIFERVRERMTKQAYGEPVIMANEAVVRAIVVNYLRAKHGAAAADASLADQAARGFVGIPQLAAALATAGPTLDARMPAVIEVFAQLSR